MAKKGASESLQKVELHRPATTLDEVMQHQADSDTWISTLRDSWDEKESMLIVKLEDAASKSTKSKIYDPRLSTIVFERAARVMAQNAIVKAFGASQDDTGKNMVMNLLFQHFRKNANEQFSHLIKMRLWDLYSLVYGTMFGLVPWRVNKRSGYIGPEFLLLPIRDCFPQPGVPNLNESDWFTARTMTNVTWLEQQDNTVWNRDEIQMLIDEMKSDKSGGDLNGQEDQNERSYVERSYFPSNTTGDTVFPRVELFTEYQDGRWITWTPKRNNSKHSRPHIIRSVENPYPEGMLPIVAKHAFPLLDSPIGLGEFERGKTLQFAINSLINLYMDGVKYSIFPPLAINADEVVASSIKWGAGEKWFMNNPNQSVQPVNLSPQGLDTFNSTYGFLLSALLNQAGTTEVNKSTNTENSLGKTPDAIKLTAARESARDEWDRFMMEESLKDVYDRWLKLSVMKLENKVAIRLYGSELEEISKQYPDAKELKFTQSKKSASLSASKQALDTIYDFELESGSTMKKDIENEQSNITSILKAVIENPQIIEDLAKKGETVDLGELFRQWIRAGGMKNTESIITKLPAQAAQPQVPQMNVDPMTGQPVAPQMNVDPTTGQPMPEMPVPNVSPEGVVPTAQPQVPVATDMAVPAAPEVPPSPNIRDPEIAAMMQQVLGGVGGIPPVQ